MRSIGAQHKVKADLDLLRAASAGLSGLFGTLDLEPGDFSFKIGAGELVVKVELDIRHLLQYVQKSPVELSSISGVYVLL